MTNWKLAFALALGFCRASSLVALTEEEISLTLRKEAVRHWSLAGDDHLRLEVLDFSHVAGEGMLTLPLDRMAQASTDGVRVIHGSLRQGPSSTPVWVRVRMSFLAPALVARRDLSARTPLGADDAQIEDVWQNMPPDVEHRLEPRQIEGAKLRRPVGAGAAIPPSAIDLPYAVHRGQSVELHVKSGAAHLRLAAVALADARAGDAVPLRVAARDGAITATVTAPGQARLSAGTQKSSALPSEGLVE